MTLHVAHNALNNFVVLGLAGLRECRMTWEIVLQNHLQQTDKRSASCLHEDRDGVKTMKD